MYTSNKNIHFEMILDVGIGEKRGNKISDLRSLRNQIPTLTLETVQMILNTAH